MDQSAAAFAFLHRPTSFSSTSSILHGTPMVHRVRQLALGRIYRGSVSVAIFLSIEGIRALLTHNELLSRLSNLSNDGLLLLVQFFSNSAKIQKWLHSRSLARSVRLLSRRVFVD